MHPDADHLRDKGLLAVLTPDEPSAAASSDQSIWDDIPTAGVRFQHIWILLLYLNTLLLPVQAQGKFFYLDADRFEDKGLLAALTPDEPSAASPSDKHLR